MRVLIVEDKPEVAGIIRGYVAPFSSFVAVADTKAEAIRLLGIPPPFDLVTLDLGLPDSKVEETVEWISELRERATDAVIVVITGMSPDEARALDLGADGILHKPEGIAEPNFWQSIGAILKRIVAPELPYKRNLEVAEKIASKLGPILHAVTSTPDGGSAHA